MAKSSLTVYGDGKYSCLVVDVVSSSVEVSEGLSGRVDVGDGMLFKVSGNRPFHMGGMLVDLCVAFVDAAGGVVKSGVYSKDYVGPIFCFADHSYVLELPAGLCDNVERVVLKGDHVQ